MSILERKRIDRDGGSRGRRIYGGMPVGKDGKKEWEIGTVLSVMMQNWSVLLCFELIYKVVGLTFFFPLLKYLTVLLPGFINENYLSQENFSKLFFNPAAIFIMLSIAVLLGVYLYIEIVALILYSEAGWKRREITLIQMMGGAVKKILGMFCSKRFAVFLLLPVMPFSFLGMASVYMRSVVIPEFILTAIMEDTFYVCALAGGTILANCLIFFYLFGFPTLLLTDMSFSGSWRESFRLLRKKKAWTIGKIIICTLVFIMMLYAVRMTVLSVIAGVVRLSCGADARRAIFKLYYNTFTGAWNILSGAFISVFFCAVIVVFYHMRRGERRPERVVGKWMVKNAVIRVLVSSSVLFVLFFMGDTEAGRLIFLPGYSEITIVAHRAGATFGPENTVAALKHAIEDGADMAEIDVQQLKDGTLVVLHDTNFLRTTGIDLNVWDAEYEQVETMDAGRMYSFEYAGEPVPTLEEMLKASKGKIHLMIELKATGREQSLVEDTLALIERYEMADQCNIASMDLGLLKQAKEQNPEIETTYITVLLVSKSYDLEQVDSYSLETSFLSRELVYQAHIQGKKVYGWTASNDENIRKILSTEADGIITDNPLLVRYHIETLEESVIEQEIANIFF